MSFALVIAARTPAPTPSWWLTGGVGLALLALHWVAPRLLTGVLLFGLSRLGWAELARTYPETTWTEWPQDPVVILGATGSVGRWGASYSVGVIAARAGIHVTVGQPAYRPFHPPLVLPWAGVQSLREERVWSKPRTVLRFADAAGRRMTLRLPADALAELRAVVG